MAFCPNCGNREEDGVAACSKCNTPIGGAAPSTKFKGTMMMGGASSAEVEAMVQKAKAAALAGQAARAASAAPAPAAAPAAPRAPTPSAAPGAPAAPDKSDEDAMAFQATIMGPITSPDGAPADLPLPPSLGDVAPDPGEDSLHYKATVAFDRAPDVHPAPGSGAPAAVIDPSAGMGFSDERATPRKKSGGGGGGKIAIIIVVLLLVLSGVATALYFAFRTPAPPAYPGYPGVPGAVPGQYPGYPGVPGVPGQVPGVPGQVPGMPGAPVPPPATP